MGDSLSFGRKLSPECSKPEPAQSPHSCPGIKTVRSRAHPQMPGAPPSARSLRLRWETSTLTKPHRTPPTPGSAKPLRLLSGARKGNPEPPCGASRVCPTAGGGASRVCPTAGGGASRVCPTQWPTAGGGRDSLFCNAACTCSAATALLMARAPAFPAPSQTAS